MPPSRLAFPAMAPKVAQAQRDPEGRLGGFFRGARPEPTGVSAFIDERRAASGWSSPAGPWACRRPPNTPAARRSALSARSRTRAGPNSKRRLPARAARATPARDRTVLHRPGARRRREGTATTPRSFAHATAAALTAVFLAGLFISVADADARPLTSHEAQAIPIALAAWGVPTCKLEAIEVVESPYPGGVAWRSPDGRRCRIRITTASGTPSSPGFCAVLVHEWGHATGHEHTATGIMAASTAPEAWPPCNALAARYRCATVRARARSARGGQRRHLLRRYRRHCTARKAR
jgi:hypothetical protein